jgi:hypothetical protein
MFLLTLSTGRTSCIYAWVKIQTARRVATRARLLLGGPYRVGSSQRGCQQCQVDLWVYRKKVA